MRNLYLLLFTFLFTIAGAAPTTKSINNILVPPNDTCASATEITPTTPLNYVTGTFSGAMMDGAAPQCATSASQDIWYRFTATDATMSVTLGSNEINHGFEIYHGNCTSAPWRCVNYNGTYTIESYFNNDFVPGDVYYVRVYNATQYLSANIVNIAVRKFPSPANDTCANATEITPSTPLNYVTGTFSGAMMDGAAPQCATSASQDIWYRFTATDATMSVTLGSNEINHGFEIYHGNCTSAPWRCVNYNGTYTIESYFNNDFVPGDVYYVRVYNATQYLSANIVNIAVRKFPSPANDTCANATEITPSTPLNYLTGTFSGAMMDGAAPQCATSASQDIWYRFTATDATMSVTLGSNEINHGFEIYHGNCTSGPWRCVDYNGTYTTESYFYNDFVSGDVYYVRVYNATQYLSANIVNIAVRKFPSPANDTCANATEITPSTPLNYLTGTFSGAMMDGAAPQCTTSASQDIWYRFTATDVTMSVTLGSNEINHGFEIYHGNCTSGPWRCVDYNGTYTTESYFYNDFVPGDVYYVRVYNATQYLSANIVNIAVRKFPSPANDTCANAQVLTPYSTCNYFNGTFSGAMMDGGTQFCAISTEQDVWYRFTATAANMTITLSNSEVNHGFEIYRENCTGTAWRCVNNNSNYAIESYIGNDFTIGQEYYVRVINAGYFSGGSFGICIMGPHPDMCAPSIAIVSAASSVCQGGSIVFNAVTAHGGTSPSYQWKVNGLNAGTNSSTFTSSALTNGSIVTCLMVSNAPCAPPVVYTSNAVTVNISASITPTFTQITGICPESIITLPLTSNNGISGTWSPALNNTATTTYTFTPNAGQCAYTTTMTIPVTNNIAPIFTQIAPICLGGTFTLPTTSNNGITGTWSPAVNNRATTTYTFNPTTGQCAATATMTVTVNNSITPTFTQVGAICSGGTFTLPATSNNGITGTWSPAVNSNATTTYTFTPATGQCAAPVTMTVTVNNSITPTFTQVGAICSGGSFTLPATSNNGITGTWSPAVNSNATTTYTFTPATGQCAAPVTMTVTVNNSITPTFTQVGAICPGGTFTLPTISTNGIVGTWIPAVNNTATTTYIFTPNAGQCASIATMTIAVTAIDTLVTVFANSITAATSSLDATYQWINCANNQPIAGETDFFYLATQNGSYAVTITENGCSATSDCAVIANMGIKPVEKSNWKLYPNPATDVLFIETDEITEIVITDVTGKTVAIEKLKSGQNNIDVSTLSSGVYLINSNSGTHVKFIKK